MTNILAAVSAPSGMWASLINWIHGWVGGGYGWTILVLIVLVKLVLSPLDYLIKHTSKKTSLIQQKCAPQVAKLRKKYANNQQMLQQQTQMLYKREGNNMWGSCIVMLVNLVLTMVIFFTLFSGLRKLSSYQAIEQYDTLRVTYERTASLSYIQDGAIQKSIADKISKGEALTEAEQTALDNALTAYYNDMKAVKKGADYTPAEGEEELPAFAEAEPRYKQANEAAGKAVQKQWDSVKQNWLWIKNIWVTDGHKNPFPDFKSLKSMAESSKKDDYKNYVYAIEKDSEKMTVFNNISNSIEAETGSWNGYYLLAIISVLLSVASQYISDLSNKSRNKKARSVADAANPQGMSVKLMKLMLPIIMAIFVLTTNSAFGIYVITNSLMSIVIAAVINLIINAVFKKRQEEVDEILAKEAERLAKKGNKQNYAQAAAAQQNYRQPLGGIDQSRFKRKK